MKPAIWIKVVPQIYKDLINTLLSCRAVFEANVPNSSVFVQGISAFTFDSERSEPTYRLQVNTENNTKDFFIARDNVDSFTVHFR